MTTEMVVNVSPRETRAALLENGVLQELFIERASKRGLTGNPRVMFFAHYYAGINELIANRPESALPLLRNAVANSWGRSAEGGPAYMWQVARVHYESAISKSSTR